ncbi:MAG: type II toxin-antitoxin system VapC family toxin [Candidatus Levybacteria bacterium]|nr:type II toxin-antitoxin system VapC family toxin [Candidatus Levybacteria bacterium]
METYVVDTSVVLKWFNQENESSVEIAHEIYKDMLGNVILLIVPSLIIIEIINTLKKGKHMPAEAIKKSISDLFSLPLVIKESSQAILDQTIEIMEAYNIAAYDALFVATAKDEYAKLISADAKAHGKITDGTVVMLENYK